MTDSAEDLVADLVADVVDEIATDGFVHDVDISSPVKSSHTEPTSSLSFAFQTDGTFADMEDVYSLASDSADELERVEEEIEELTYCHIAAKMAKDAVDGGCIHAEACSDMYEAAQEIEDWGNATEETAAYWEAEDMGNAPEETAAYWEAEDMDTMCLASPGLLDVTTDVEEGLGEFWGEGSNWLAFDMTQNILVDAFDEVAVTWKSQISNSGTKSDKDPHNLEEPTREEQSVMKVRDTMDRALKSGDFTKEVKKALEADRWSILQQKMQKGFGAAASNGDLTSVFQEVCNPMHELPQPVPPQPLQQTTAPTPKFRTTCVATFKTRPIVAPTQCEAPVSTDVVVDSVPDTPREMERPSSRRSTRSRRRVIGAAVRTLATEGQERDDAEQPKKDLKAKGKQSRLLPDTYSLDQSGGEGIDSDCARESSIVRGYNALGAKHYNLESQDGCLPVSRGSVPFTYSSSSSSASRNAFKMKAPELIAPALDRAFSKAGSRLRAASVSAMAVDLGFAAGDSLIDRNSVHVDFTSQIAPKAKLHGGLLPMIPSAKKSSKSIALTMQMSKTASRWCNTGLRGSASAVF